MSQQCAQNRSRGSENGVAEPPMRLIMACMAVGMIVGAILSPGKPDFVKADSGTLVVVPAGR